MRKISIMRKIAFIVAVLLIVSSCTDKGEIYNSSKHSKDEFSAGNSLLLGLGAAIVAAEYCRNRSCAGGGTSGDYDWDWDYLPGSGQWRCRGIQTGRFAPNSNCAYDELDDDRWP